VRESCTCPLNGAYSLLAAGLLRRRDQLLCNGNRTADAECSLLATLAVAWVMKPGDAPI
jgi:hypothetical protein